MRPQVIVASMLILFLGFCPARADDPASADDNKMQPLARFAGEWTIDAKWSDGSPLQARGVYDWGLSKRIMTAKTFVKKGDGEYQRYEGIMAWNPKKKSLYEISFTYSGEISETLIELVDKDTMNIGWTPFDPGTPSKVRQVLKFLDDDSFNWKVELETNGNWQQIMDGTWHRKK